jgi:hypothetical protein
LSSRGPTCCTTQQRPTNIEPLRKLKRTGQTPDQRSQKRPDWHTCMPPVSWLHRHLWVSPAHNARTLRGSTALQTVLGELRFSRSVQGYRHRASSEAHERLQDAHTSASGHSPEPPGSTNTPGCSRTPPGVHRRSILPGRDFRDPPHDLSSTDRFGSPPDSFGCPPDDFGRPQVRSVRHEHLRMFTGTSGFQPSLFGALIEASSSKLAVPRR